MNRCKGFGRARAVIGDLCVAAAALNAVYLTLVMLRRAPAGDWLTEEWQSKMEKITGCLHCGQCKTKCPYGLDTPALLKRNYEDYKTFLK